MEVSFSKEIVACAGGHQGAPVSHLLDVTAQHGAPPRPVREQPIRFMRKPT